MLLKNTELYNWGMERYVTFPHTHKQFSSDVASLDIAFPAAYLNTHQIFAQGNDLCSAQILSCSTHHRG